MARKGARKERVIEADLLDRDLSWLEFNARVLALAEDPSVPLLERLKFLAIFSGNLDEFFMVRVAGLAGRVAAGLGAAAAGGLEPAAQLKAIRARVPELVAQHTRTSDDLLAAVEMQLRQRRFGRAVRLEVDAAMPAGVRELLLRELQLGADDLYAVPPGDTPGPPGSAILDMGSLSELYALNRPELKYPP